LTVSASKYTSSSLDDETTQPTGFDPQAAALFEAVVESAFLVANADGEFDDVERRAFMRVVLSACKGSVSEQQINALLADLGDLLEEDGIDKRVGMVARTITRPEQAHEVLRIAGLIAHVSDGVSSVERAVLDKLASEFRLDRGAVEGALAEVTRALSE
jgi:tellurite resistance protein